MSIDNLCNDIYSVLMHEHKGEVSSRALEEFYESSGLALRKAVESPDRAPRENGVFYASELQDLVVCPRKSWYKINAPESAETLMPHVRIKFLYGDMIESLIVFLAEQAGHPVHYTQEVVEHTLPGTDVRIRGRIDGVIDGYMTDVKSASPYAFNKLKSPDYDPATDMFSYDLQVNFYATHFDDEGKPELTERDEQRLILVDKQSGTLAQRRVPRNERRLEGAKENAVLVTSSAKAPGMGDHTSYPDAIGQVPTTHGNIKLATYCSYCAFKSRCWSDNGVKLRGFAYSNGPVYMTKVNKVPPKVPEFEV
jgi:hypothetical protein